MREYDFFNLIMLSFGFSSLLFFIVLLFITAGYGQHINKKWGPTINNKLGWIIMEIPTVIIYLFYYLLGNRKADLVPLLFM
ncbi:MAG: 3-oxo-5-alpha-steroid 4-dehydrogenase, partial [Promethearchaeota archaeon]